MIYVVDTPNDYRLVDETETPSKRSEEYERITIPSAKQ